ncbi:MAG: glycerophosphoryl diester phosphodiesterase membrane domain-containing protein [Pontixanthobacter sp.]
MKFDMNAAWNDTVAMLKANTDVLGIVAAVFFFLPSLALTILAPGTELEAAAGDPDRLSEAMTAYFTASWWVLLLYGLITIVGTLAIFALFGRRSKPTVGEAISAGFRGFVPYLLSLLLVGVAIGLIAILIGVIVGLTGIAALGVLFAIIMAIVLLVVSIRILLTGPIIAIENEGNPIAALKRSWATIKGHTRRVFAFVFLLAIAITVVSLVLGFLFAGLGALLGPTLGLWVEGLLGALLGAVTTIILLAAYTAVYRQLAGDVTRQELETFE